jgi:hypothetical protein
MKPNETFAELCLCIPLIDEQKKVAYILFHKQNLKVLSGEMDPAEMRLIFYPQSSESPCANCLKTVLPALVLAQWC